MVGMTKLVNQKDSKIYNVAYYIQKTEKWSLQREHKMHMDIILH